MDTNPQKLNSHKIKQQYCTVFCYITIANKTYLIIGQQGLRRFLVPYALFN